MHVDCSPSMSVRGNEQRTIRTYSLEKKAEELTYILPLMVSCSESCRKMARLTDKQGSKDSLKLQHDAACLLQ